MTQIKKSKKSPNSFYMHDITLVFMSCEITRSFIWKNILYILPWLFNSMVLGWNPELTTNLWTCIKLWSVVHPQFRSNFPALVLNRPGTLVPILHTSQGITKLAFIFLFGSNGELVCGAFMTKSRSFSKRIH